MVARKKQVQRRPPASTSPGARARRVGSVAKSQCIMHRAVAVHARNGNACNHGVCPIDQKLVCKMGSHLLLQAYGIYIYTFNTIDMFMITRTLSGVVSR